jgi:leucyl aminopeptidase
MKLFRNNHPCCKNILTLYSLSYCGGYFFLNVYYSNQSKRYVLLGLGKPSKADEAKSDGKGLLLGKSIANLVANESKVTSCTVILPHILKEYSTLSDISSSIYSSLYSDNRYRTGDKIKKLAEDLKSITLVAEANDLPEDATEAIQLGVKLARGIILTKDIVNSPHNVLNSVSLANTAKRIAEQSNGFLSCTILDKVECEKRGMGAYLAVARGSETEPQFIHLVYTPKTTTENKKVAIVGKGLLFDTGGYNIKTQMMDLMKFDCGGSAAVFGAARVIAELAPEGVEAHFIVAACENMINSRAMVPSDVLTASNGKTIEVGNTDAEGRLTLADALVYADKEVGCEAIIELSTLTGACMISLGKGMAGLWTANDDLAKDLETVSKVTGDKIWRMPLETSYNEQLESKIADLNNIGTSYGGAITAALFLQNFVNKKKPFAHIDIAGPVWNEKTGATGYGTRLVTEWIKQQGIKKVLENK